MRKEIYRGDPSETAFDYVPDCLHRRENLLPGKKKKRGESTRCGRQFKGQRIRTKRVGYILKFPERSKKKKRKRRDAIDQHHKQEKRERIRGSEGLGEMSFLSNSVGRPGKGPDSKSPLEKKGNRGGGTDEKRGGSK